MKQFLIDEPLAITILNYLGKRPYIEVAALIAGLMQLQEAPRIAVPPVSLAPKES